MSSSLKITELTAWHDKETILHNISVEILPAQVTVLMGTSGSGKTTLLLCVLGIHKAHSGTIFLGSKDITNLSLEKRNIGYLQQDYGLFPKMNVQDNVAFGLRVRGIGEKERIQKAHEVLEMVNLKGCEKRTINELSGGQKQMVGLARALAIDPDLLLLDEPLSHIDQITKADVAKQLRELFKQIKIPVILVTHAHEDALFLADKLIVLMDGKIAQEGIFKEILENPNNDYVKKILRPFS